MTWRTSLFTLALLASVGINIGLLTHLGSDWQEDRQTRIGRESLPGRLNIANFTYGSCESGLTFNEAAVTAFIAQEIPALDISAQQTGLLGQLIVARADLGCRVPPQRQALATAMRERPFQDTQTGAAFLGDVLALRTQITEAGSREAALQAELFASFTPEQLAAVPPRELPRLVPGLNLQSLFNRPSNRRERGIERHKSDQGRD